MFRLTTTYDFKGRAAFAAFAPRNWSETLSFTIPFSYLHFMTRYLPIFPEAFDNIWAITDSIMKSREARGVTGTDFVGRLMELIKDVEREPNAPNHKDLTRGIITSQVCMQQMESLFLYILVMVAFGRP